MVRLILLICLFITTVSLRVASDAAPEKSNDAEACGILAFSAKNNMTPDDPPCILNSVGIIINPVTVYYP